MEVLDEFVESFSYEALNTINDAIGMSYEIVNDTIMCIPMFNVQSAASYKQNLYNLALDHSLVELSKSNKLKGVEVHFLFNKKNNHQHIQLEKNNCILTFSSFNNRSYKSLPRRAYFREENSCGQMSFDDLLSPNKKSSEMIYAIINHTNSSSMQSYIGIPDKNYTGWVQSKGLNKLCSEYREKRPQMVIMPQEDVLVSKLKQNIKQVIGNEVKEQNG